MDDSSRIKRITTDEFYKMEEQKSDHFDNYLDNVIAKLIGITVISFNALETAIDYTLTDIISSDSDDKEWIIIKTMGYQQKVILMIDLMLVDVEAYEIPVSKLKQMRESLLFAGQKRNRIVHADWESLTKSNHVKSKTKVQKGDGMIYHEMIQFTIKDFTSDIDFIDDIAAELWGYKRIA